MMPVTSKNKTVLSLVCLSILIIIFIAGLWPFNLNPLNKVEWLKNEPGVRFKGPGHLYSSEDLGSEIPGRNISLELWLRPGMEPNNRLPHILSFWDGRRQEVFLLGQWKDSLVLRIRSLNPKAARGFRERGSGHTLIKNQDIFLTLTSSQEGTRIYNKGAPVKEFPGYPLLEDWSKRRGVLVLGNSADGRHYWEGEVFGLALYNRVLSNQEVGQNYSRWIQGDYRYLKSSSGLVGLYTFVEGQGEWVPNLAGKAVPLFKPVFFHPPQKVVLEWPTKEYLKRLSFYEDMAVNVLGFIPLGFFFAFWLLYFAPLTPTRASVLTFFLGSLISLAIELAQVYLPGRDSSASDLIFNMIGTLIGIALLDLFLKERLIEN